ncbi:MAG: hypothetical protein D3916_00970 [Candidatus Electrothrix sp. MAN1_4]|nr:hypothetical protein [Candidatus Electrothrix sp. MAN1_4]
MLNRKKQHEDSTMSDKDFSAPEINNALEGTGLSVTGMVTGYQNTKPRADKETGEVSEARHYVFLACKNTAGVKVKLKREPDPSIRPVGSQAKYIVTLTSFNNQIYYSEA